MRILLVDDEPAALAAISSLLRHDHDVEACASGAEALARLEQSAYDLLMTDLSMPHPDGFHLLQQSSTLAPGMPVVVVTALDTARAAVQAIRLGARDFLVKPASADDIRALVQRLSAEHAGRDGTAGHLGLVGHSAALRRVIQLVPLLARCREPVLIRGESGTGKESLARAIHASGARREREFVACSIAAVPGESVDRELFGAAHGPGTSPAAPCHFERAAGGTLFLKGIEALPLALQARLLRVLESGSWPAERGGGVPDVRVIASSSEDLGDLVARGRFRADLYFRLRQLEVAMPALRDRPDDLPVLAEYFLAESEPEPTAPRITRTAMALLRAHAWPGNCRELRSALRSAQLLSGGAPIQPGHLPHALAGAAGGRSDAVITLAEAEREHIRRALEQVRGNRSRAARLLGIDRGTLSRKLRAMGLEQNPS